MDKDRLTLILDIGKTNVKCHVIDQQGESIWHQSMPAPDSGQLPYLNLDVESIWQWLVGTTHCMPFNHRINAINVSTHGASVVLLNKSGQLALPVLDYECTDIEECSTQYDEIRPVFEDSFSPRLPAGLNMGRQLFWLKQKLPNEFRQTSLVLMYPQYWVWRMTGKAVTELSSLGCHTDLWLPKKKQYSSLPAALNLEGKFPPIVAASEQIGNISSEFSAKTGIPVDCRVYAGVHDSNASLAAYLYGRKTAGLTVISAGTWVVSMNTEGDLNLLDDQRDMLSAVNVAGEPVSCARFMGGREFAEICQLTNARLSDKCEVSDIAKVIQDEVFARPAFVQLGGPFSGQQSEITATPDSGKALAIIYLVLMMDYELDLLNSTNPVILEGLFTRNPMMANMLAQLRPTQSLFVSSDEATTVTGAWCLTRWEEAPPSDIQKLKPVVPSTIENWPAYRNQWRTML